MKEKKPRKSLSYYCGYALSATLALAIATCGISILGALTYKFVTWIWGMVL